MSVTNNNFKKRLKAFVRLDSNGFVVPGSLVLRINKPAHGRWFEVEPDQCCTTTSTTSTSTSTTTTTTTTP